MKSPWISKLINFTKVPDQHKEEVRKSMVRLAAVLGSYALTIVLVALAGVAFSHFYKG